MGESEPVRKFLDIIERRMESMTEDEILTVMRATKRIVKDLRKKAGREKSAPPRRGEDSNAN